MSVALSDALLDRLPPCNVEAEEALLGGCMTFEGVIQSVRADLRAEDFYRDRNATIYRAMVGLCDRGVPVDRTTLADELKRADKFDEVGGAEYMARLATLGFLAGNAEAYAEIISRTGAKRRLISAAGRIAAIAYDDSVELEEALSRAMGELSSVQTRIGRYNVDTPQDQACALLEMVTELTEKGTVGIKTGLADLDRVTGGFEPGQLITAMAVTGMGKSALAQSIARNMADRHHPVLYCTVEMTTRQLIKRNVSALSGMDWREIQTRLVNPEQRNGVAAVVHEVVERIDALPFHVYYRPTMTVSDVRLKALEWKARYGIEFVVVDYLQILTPPKAENRNREVGVMLQQLKALAGEVGVPVMVLSQLNRDNKARQDKRPTLTDARDSGSVEQDSDMVLGLYRDDYYYSGLNEKQRAVEKGRAELIVLKQREGPAHVKIDLSWKERTCEYVSYYPEA